MSRYHAHWPCYILSKSRCTCICSYILCPLCSENKYNPWFDCEELQDDTNDTKFTLGLEEQKVRLLFPSPSQ